MNRNHKILAISIMGTVIEWYDYAIFTAMLPILSKLFFPNNDAKLAFLYTFCIFASGFLARPLGAALFGYLGDKYGRPSTLSITLINMAIPTILIGCLPQYNRIGFFAPLLLIILRLWQSVSAGGEHSGAVVYLAENASKNKIGLWSSFCFSGVMMGGALGLIVCTVITRIFSIDVMYSFGWRVPFFLSFPLGFLGYYIRKQRLLNLNLNFNVTKVENTNPIMTLLNKYKINTLLAICVLSITYAVFYSIFVFLPSYIIHSNILTMHISLLINTINMVIMVIVIILSGYLSDKIGCKPIMKLTAVALILFSYPLIILYSSGRVYDIFISELIFAVINGLYLGPSASFIVQLFPVNVRYTGVAISLNVTAVLFGVMLPLVVFQDKLLLYNLTILSAFFIVLGMLSYFSINYISKLQLNFLEE